MYVRWGAVDVLAGPKAGMAFEPRADGLSMVAVPQDGGDVTSVMALSMVKSMAGTWPRPGAVASPLAKTRSCPEPSASPAEADASTK